MSSQRRLCIYNNRGLLVQSKTPQSTCQSNGCHMVSCVTTLPHRVPFVSGRCHVLSKMNFDGLNSCVLDMKHTNCVSPVTPLTLYSSIDKNVRCVAWLLQLNLTSIGAWFTRSPTPWKFGSDQLFIGSRQPKNQSVRLGSLLTSSVTYVYIWHLLDLPVQINFDRITSDHITT